MHSPDLTQDNIAKIRALFPDCVTEAAGQDGVPHLAIDFDQLRQQLSDHIVEGPQERYRLDWPGKREALLTANAPIAKTLRPARDESVDFDTTQNLFIEGDNLDALKLLQESYLGKVKLIYIDPPYNTGNDFIYDDDFAETTAEFLVRSNQANENGGRLVANSESNGRFHSDWLSMMYARLKLARNFLTHDGAIFISVDQNEHENLKLACDEVFGSGNFIASLSVINNMKGRNDKAHVATAHEYLLIYQKEKLISYGIPLTEEQLAEYKFFDDQGNRYALRDLRKRGRPDRREDRPKMYFPIYYDPKSEKCSVEPQDGWVEITPKRGDKSDGRWRWGIDAVRKNIEILHPKFSKQKDRWDISHRVYLDPSVRAEPDSDIEDDDDDNLQRTSKPKSFLWGGDISTDVANREFKKLFPGTDPDYPKSPYLLEKIIHMGSRKGDTVLDFFGGYATTADSVFRLAAAGSPRRFIMVQLACEIDPKSPMYGAGYRTIADIAKERIRRAGQKVLEGECHEGWNRDVGFRVLKIDSSNMADVFYRPDEVKQDELFGQVDSVKPGRTDEDLLFQVLIDWGVELTLPITRETLHGKTIYCVDGNALIACFEAEVSEALVKEIAARAPLRAVFRDTSFAQDAGRINAEQLFRQLSPGTDVKAI